MSAPSEPPDVALVDVHCHIHAPEFDPDREQVLREARALGVRFVFGMGEDAADNERLLAASRAGSAPDSARILPCFGLHPDRVPTQPVAPVIEQIEAHRAELVAIGEVGLDYRIAEKPDQREQQREVLRRLAQLAMRCDLPLSVHSRSAGHYTIDLLAELQVERVCMHAFDGAAKHAVRAAEQLGYYFSVPPSVVRSPQKQKMVRRLPLERMLLETDAPVLGADREQRNVPRNVVVSAEAIAQLKRLPLARVLEQVAENTRRLFRLEL